MNLKQKITSGLLWSGTSSQGARQIFGFVITAILARLLTPDDFGVVGMATVFTGFIYIFNEMGLGASLIQKQELTDRHISKNSNSNRHYLFLFRLFDLSVGRRSILYILSFS